MFKYLSNLSTILYILKLLLYLFQYLKDLLSQFINNLIFIVITVENNKINNNNNNKIIKDYLKLIVKFFKLITT